MIPDNLYAIVKDGIVENTIILNDSSSWKLSDLDSQIVKVTEDTGLATIGLSYSEGKFEQIVFAEELPNHGF